MGLNCERIIAQINKVSPYEDVNEDTELIESGIIDSLSLLMLITLINEEFNINIIENDFIRANFKSVSTIECLVKKYKD